MPCCSETWSGRLHIPPRAYSSGDMDRDLPKNEPFPSRKSCIDCVEKHLGHVWVLYSEYHDGYPYRGLIVGHLGEAEAESEAWPSLHRCIRNARKTFQATGKIYDLDFLFLKVGEVRSLHVTDVPPNVSHNIDSISARLFLPDYPLYVGCIDLTEFEIRKLSHELSSIQQNIRLVGLGTALTGVVSDDPLPDWVVCLPHGYVSWKTFYEMIHGVIIKPGYNIPPEVKIPYIQIDSWDTLRHHLEVLLSAITTKKWAG